jgi:hypothetical protein
MTTLRAGAAQADITPPLGATLTGYIMRTGAATGVHDPLYAKALLLELDGQYAVILACDLLGLEAATVRRVRAAIEAATGIPVDRILIACTHTHAGPASMFLQDCGEVDAAWLNSCEQRLVEIVQLAKMRLAPATLGAAYGAVTSGVHNRRTPGDVIDPALGVVRVVDPAGAPVATLLNYTCHPTLLGAENQLLSAEYPGLATRAVQSALRAPCLFLTEAIGDVGPTERGFARLEQMGVTVAREARRVLAHTPTQTPHHLAVVSRTLPLPLQALPAVDEIERYLAEKRRLLHHATRAGQLGQVKISQAMVHWAERTLMQLASGMPPSVEVEIQVIRLDKLVLVGVPGEFFVELGLQIKAAAPDDQVMVVGFANGNVGYIPARRAYPHGGYEIDEAYRYYGYPSVFAPETGEMIVATAGELIQATQG